ncbi:MAG: dihydrodipicolinate synthase family protein [Clostridiales bacterium]|nr:dihydrodipicolinate synthase family protein [Clostridiales bacterium]
MKKLYGVITAMTTPFTADNHVDVSALEAQVEFLIGKGVQCLYPCGTTGEMYLMSSEERELVAETVVKKAAGRVTVFIHVGAMDQAETIRLARHASKIGADGVGVVTPSYFGVDERAMVSYYKAVCDSLPQDFPVYVYVIPQLAHNDVTAATMEKIAATCKNVVGVKYSFADMRRINEYLLVRGGNFSVVPGADDLFLPALVCGCDGVVSGCSGPFPEAFENIYQAYLSGDLNRARMAQQKATELVKVMKFGGDMSIFKNILTLRGVTGGHMRKPLLDLTSEQTAELKKTVTPYL